MQDLIAFLLRFGGLFTFVALECVCALLIVRHNDPQRQIWLHSANQWSASWAERRDALQDFVDLRSVADSLAAENARLRLQLLLQPNTLLDSVVLVPADSSYTLVPTRVIRNSVMRANNTLTIDRGMAQGILPRQGVITGRSVLGITRNVGEHYAEVISLLHSESRLSASLQRSGYFGVLVWRGDDPREHYLEEVPRHASLSKGDTVITSGYSAMFPRGIYIGRVDSFWVRPGSDFYDIRVVLGHDPANIDYAYVIRRAADAERVIFEEQLPDAR